MNIRNRHLRSALVSACLALGGMSATLAAPRVYVANETDGSVSVIATDTHQTVRTIPVGAGTQNVQATADGQRVWVTNNGTPPAEAGQAALPGMSGAAHAAITNPGEVWAIDTATDTMVGKVPVGRGPAQVGFTDDGRLAFVSLSQEDRVAVIDPKTREVLRKVAVGDGPIQLFATPDSQRLLVANQGLRENPGRTVSVIDLTFFKLTASIPTGRGAHGVVVDADGRQAYMTNLYDHTVAVIDLVTHQPVAIVTVGAGPNGISVTP